MKNITVDGLVLTDKMVTELKQWYRPECVDSYPEEFIGYIEHTKDTLIRLMCEENEKYDTAIKECLSGIISIQDSLRNLLPETK